MEEVILLLDFDNVCRLCLQSKGQLSSIFSPYEDVGLHEIIHDLTGVSMSQEDSLPNKICHRCRYLVETSCDLKKAVIKANDLLSVSFEDQIVINDTSVPTEVESSVQNEGEDERIPKMEGTQMKANDDWSLLCHKSEDSTKFIKKYQSIKNITCQICLRKFVSTSLVVEHAQAEHYCDTKLTPYFDIKMPYSCEDCQKTFDSKRLLIAHHRKHLNVQPFSCKLCNFQTSQNHVFKNHEKSHNKSHVCEKCGASYVYASELKKHNMRHADEGRVFPCQLCRVVCRNRITLQGHMRYHLLGRRFKCTHEGCPKAFFTRSNLAVHLRSHANERAYKCHLCVSSYISQSLLNRHLRQHEKQRINKCDKCSATFEDYAMFYNHRINVHGPWQPYKCMGCSQGYQSVKQFELHLERCQAVKQKLKDIGNKKSESETALMEKLQVMLMERMNDDGTQSESATDNLDAESDLPATIYIEVLDPSGKKSIIRYPEPDGTNYL